MSLAGNICRHLDAVGQPHARHLSKRGIRLLRRSGVHSRADTPFLRRTLESWGLTFVGNLLSALSNKLIYRWQFELSKIESKLYNIANFSLFVKNVALESDQRHFFPPFAFGLFLADLFRGRFGSSDSLLFVRNTKASEEFQTRTGGYEVTHDNVFFESEQ